MARRRDGMRCRVKLHHHRTETTPLLGAAGTVCGVGGRQRDEPEAPQPAAQLERDRHAHVLLHAAAGDLDLCEAVLACMQQQQTSAAAVDAGGPFGGGWNLTLPEAGAMSRLSLVSHPPASNLGGLGGPNRRGRAGHPATADEPQDCALLFFPISLSFLCSPPTLSLYVGDKTKAIDLLSS